jgi:hypothetical protein
MTRKASLSSRFLRSRSKLLTPACLIILAVVTAAGYVAVHPGHASAGACGISTSPPNSYQHVIWIWMENKSASSIIGASSAPFVNSQINECAHASNLVDNVVPTLPSEPNYLAATSGSNCVTGIGTSGSGCLMSDADAVGSNTLPTKSLFEQVNSAGKTWKSYQEGMPSPCSTSSSGRYATKHNPAAYFTNIRATCAVADVSIPAVSCPTTLNSFCSNPTGSFVSDLASGSLPAFSFVTPSLDNDMHDGTVTQGDNWLKTYIPLITASPNYQSGSTAVFVMWDEGAVGGDVIPNVIIAPSIIPGSTFTGAMNNMAILGSTERLLNLPVTLGCASGSAPGGGSCPVGSTTDITTAVHLISKNQAFEAEAGSLGAGAKIITVSGASNGSAVQFLP